MADRPLIIGALGGDRQEQHAFALGRAIARHGCILLTGGGDVQNAEVKNAAVTRCLAARNEGHEGRAIGVLPSRRIEWEYRGPCHLLIHSGLEHNFRNVINGVTPDVAVVSGGARGTLAEAAFAIAARKPVFFFGGEPEQSALARLSANLKKHFADTSGGNGAACRANVNEYLTLPWSKWAPPLIPDVRADSLLEMLDRELQRAREWEGDADSLIAHCINEPSLPAPLPKSGFPGLPGNPASHAQFEEALARMIG